MIGIENVNEFYTHHYLAAIFGGEVRGVFAALPGRGRGSALEAAG